MTVEKFRHKFVVVAGVREVEFWADVLDPSFHQFLRLHCNLEGDKIVLAESKEAAAALGILKWWTPEEESAQEEGS